MKAVMRTFIFLFGMSLLLLTIWITGLCEVVLVYLFVISGVLLMGIGCQWVADYCGRRKE